MKKRWMRSPALFPLLCAVLISTPAGAFVSPKGRDLPLPAGEIIRYHDRNQVRLAVSNTGQIGNDLFTGNAAGFWPKDLPNDYVFGGGLWIGGTADIDGDAEAETLFIQAYDPNCGGSEFREGRYGQSPDDPLARVFVSTDATSHPGPMSSGGSTMTTRAPRMASWFRG